VPPSDGLTVTWIGHATLLVQMDGLNVLTDPIFSARCAPVPVPRLAVRYRPPPCTIDDLPHIDAVLISHNHYDHLDNKSVLQLNHRFGPHLTWFVPTGLRTWMHSAGCQRVVELGWWQEHSFVKETVSDGAANWQEHTFVKETVSDGAADWQEHSFVKETVSDGAANWQEHTFVRDGVTDAAAKFVCVPAQHWSKRGIWDDNKVQYHQSLLS